MTESDDTESFGISSRVNDDYNVIRIRLDASDIIERIETYLRGYKVIESENQEGVSKNIIKFSEPKMNHEGIGTLLNWISGTLNAQIVQGNFPIEKGFSEKYEAYIFEYHISLLKMVVINCVDWELEDREIEPLVDFLMLMIIPFMSRLIGNKERESYSETIRSVESQNIRSGGGKLSNLFKKQ